MHFVGQTGSTNSDMLADAAWDEGDWLIAGEQLAGRGRQGREWRSAAGNFFGSTIVRLQPVDPPPHSLSLVAALALIEAVDAAAPGRALMLKWPNDLLLLGKKMAGILLERGGDRVAVGFGVNLRSAPALADREASSLGGSITPQAFAPLLAASFARLLRLWRTSEPSLMVQAWMARAHPVGSKLKVQSGDEVLEGRFDGLDRDGALRLRVSGGAIEVIRAADVEL